MPNCFTLTKKGQKEPSKLAEIDDEICAMLGVPADPDQYHPWYYYIGLGLACGSDWAKLRAGTKSEQMRRCIDYLEANYSTDAWAEIGRG